MSEHARLRKDEFNSCWIGDRLLPIAHVCLNSFGAHGFGFNLYTYGQVTDVPRCVNVKNAEGILPYTELFVAHGGMETAADLFAYRFLYRVGGWFVDNDVACNADRVPDAEIAFAEERANIINNAVLKFPKSHPAIGDVLAYVATVDPVNAPWGATGPLALTKILGSRDNLTQYRLDTADVYPLHLKEAPKLLFPEFKEEIANKVALAPFVHLWGATLREIGFDFRVHPPSRLVFGCFTTSTGCSHSGRAASPG